MRRFLVCKTNDNTLEWEVPIEGEISLSYNQMWWQNGGDHELLALYDHTVMRWILPDGSKWRRILIREIG